MPTVEVEQALTEAPEALGPAILGLPEDQWFDRKSIRIAPRDLADVLIGFANADGGTVVVGLRDGMVEGVDQDPSRLNALRQAAIDFVSPPVRVGVSVVRCLSAADDEDHLLVFDIDPSDQVHANRKDEVYLRVGDENRRLTFAQRQELLYDKGQAAYETRLVPEAQPGDLDAELLSGYAAALSHPDPVRLLEARGLTRGGQLTVAGCLLFDGIPQRLFPEAFIRVLRYRGRDRGSGARQQLHSDIRIDGPIPLALQEARAATRAVQPVRRALLESGRFGDVPLVPEDAWLEGLVNAAVHRSYSMAGDHIRVEIFDDRIEISSPGRFPGIVALSDPRSAPRFARNPRIARVCSDLQFGQELGEGIRRIYDEMRHAGLGDPVYRQTAGSVELVLSAEPADRELQARLPAETRLIVAALRRAERLSTGEIAGAIGVSRPVAISRLKELRDAGVVEWVGKSPKDPRAFWTLPST